VKAVTWQGKRDVRYVDVPDPKIEEATDALIRVTSTNICGSDLHLYEVLGAFMEAGDVLGHEAMGIVEEVGDEVTAIKPGDRVVIPFQMSCGQCFMCGEQLYSQCETTQVREYGSGAALFGYSKLYGQVPGGQAEYVRVPHAQFTHIKVPDGPPDERFVYLSDVLPTAWQAVQYAAIPDGGTVAVLGLGPIGDMSCRIAAQLGARVIGVDLVPERLERVRSRGNEVVDLSERDSDLGDVLRSMTGGRGPDSVIDAVGMEAHGSSVPKLAQTLTALYSAIDGVRRGGTISLSGVYGGTADPVPMLQMFDKQIQLRMGQANVKRWVDDILPLLTDDDPLGVESFATHRLPLADAAGAYERFQKKQNGTVKVVMTP
jgi:threonine dehydrogenase-like Zn-dependent dehydrogenase